MSTITRQVFSPGTKHEGCRQLRATLEETMHCCESSVLCQTFSRISCNEMWSEYDIRWYTIIFYDIYTCLNAWTFWELFRNSVDVSSECPLKDMTWYRRNSHDMTLQLWFWILFVLPWWHQLLLVIPSLFPTKFMESCREKNWCTLYTRDEMRNLHTVKQVCRSMRINAYPMSSGNSSHVTIWLFNIAMENPL